jgi:hypothetical protein
MLLASVPLEAFRGSTRVRSPTPRNRPPASCSGSDRPAKVAAAGSLYSLRCVGAVSPPTLSGLLHFGSSKPGCGAAPTVFRGLESPLHLHKGLSIEKVRSVSRSLPARQRPDYSECARGSRSAISEFGKRTGHTKVVRNVSDADPVRSTGMPGPDYLCVLCVVLARLQRRSRVASNLSEP